MKRTIFGILMLVMPFTAAALAPGEGISLDPNSGDYIIRYVDDFGQLRETRFVPSTKIVPTLYSSFEHQQHGLVHYRYVIKNGATSKQPLIRLVLDPISSVSSNTAFPETMQGRDEAMRQVENDRAQLEQLMEHMNDAVEHPAGWHCRVLPKGESVPSGFRIPCSFDNLDEAHLNGLQPGKSVSGFGFYSVDLPGIEMAHLQGFGDMGPGFPDEGPVGDVSDEIDAIVKNDFVGRPAAIPAIALPHPFNAATLLDSMQAQTHTWIGMRLLDPVFSSQLDGHFQSAINAYQHNQPKVAREEIDAMHAMLMREHRDLDQEDEHADERDRDNDATHPMIDRLAARVLDFDLKEVVRRAGEQDKD